MINHLIIALLMATAGALEGRMDALMWYTTRKDPRSPFQTYQQRFDIRPPWLQTFAYWALPAMIDPWHRLMQLRTFFLCLAVWFAGRYVHLPEQWLHGLVLVAIAWFAFSWSKIISLIINQKRLQR